MLKRTKIYFEKTNTEVPIIKIKVGNVDAYAVVDSGSESTSFDYMFVKSNKEHFSVQSTDDKISLIGISSDNEVPVLYATSKLHFSNDASVDCKGIIIPLAHLSQHMKDIGSDIKVSAVIGADVLTEIGAKLNFKKKVMTVCNDLSCK